MQDDLPCPVCLSTSQTGPSYSDDGMTIWWDCECGIKGPEATSHEEAIRLWNQFVKNYNRD
jgi:hypothetical protein